MLPSLDHRARLGQDLDETIRRVLTHRRCVPGDAAYVELVCRARPGVLPRWHQDDRGRRNATRGHHQYAPDGAYSRVSVWVSREHWLSTVVPVALAFHAQQLRGRVSPGLMRRYLTVRSGYALPGTGRRCIVRPDTIASVLAVSVNTVKVCQRMAREIGLEVVIAAGRMLTLHECLAARRRGSRQRGLSTEVAFTTPHVVPSALWINTPTRGTHLPAQLDCENPSFTPKTAASGQRKDAAPPHRPRQQGGDRAAVRRLALEVANQLPWLAGESPRRLAPALTRFVTCSPAWTAQDLLGALADAALRTGRLSPLADRAVQTRPAVLFAAVLRGLDEQGDYPGPAFPAPAPVSVAVCERPGCDGWITTSDTHGSVIAVRPCLQVDHRRASVVQAVSEGDGWDADGSPF